MHPSNTIADSHEDLTRRHWTAVGIMLGGMLVIAAWCYRLGESSVPRELWLTLRRAATDDSWRYMNMALDWYHAHPRDDLYQQLFFEHHVQFFYPLTSLLPLLGLDALGLGTHSALTYINFFAFLTSVLVLACLLPAIGEAAGVVHRGTYGRFLLAFLGAVATTLFYPLLKGFTLGQIQVWLDVAFFIACLAYLGGKSVVAGCFMGFSSLIKPQMVLFLPWALLRKDFRFAFGWVLVVGPAILIALVYFEPRQLASYSKVLAFLADHGEAYYANQTFNGLMNRALGDSGIITWSDTHYPPVRPLVVGITRLAGAAFVLLGLSWKWRERESFGFNSFVVAAICFTAASPIAWEHHYGILLPAFFLAYITLAARARERATALLGIAYLLCANSFTSLHIVANTPFNFVQSYVLFGALVLLGLLLRNPLTLERRATMPAISDGVAIK